MSLAAGALVSKVACFRASYYRAPDADRDEPLSQQERYAGDKRLKAGRERRYQRGPLGYRQRYRTQ